MGIQNFTQFNIDVLSGKDSIFDDSIQFKSLMIKEEVNGFPEIVLVLSTFTEILNLEFKDLVIKLNVGNRTTLSMEFGVQYANYTNEIELRGLMCKHEVFSDISSEYLGGDIVSAINSLDIRDNVSGLDSISGNYFRLNESKLSALLRLLRGAKENSVFLIDHDNIKLVEVNRYTNSLDFVNPKRLELLSTNRAYPEAGLVKLFESSDSNSGVFNNTWNSLNFIGYFNKPFADNFVSSLRNRHPLDTVAILVYESEFPYSIGDVMTISTSRLPYTKAIILSKIRTYAKGSMTSRVIIGGSNE